MTDGGATHSGERQEQLLEALHVEGGRLTFAAQQSDATVWNIGVQANYNYKDNFFPYVALAYETCARAAAERGAALADHAAHLIVHGLLHLAGYDHETSMADAEAMEALETKALAVLGVGDPYCGREE